MSDLNKQGLTDLYNSNIVKAEPMTREGNWSGIEGKGFHQEEKITTSDNKEYLIHNVPSENAPKITPAENMSSKWQSAGEQHDVQNGQTVGGAMNAVGDDKYSLTNNNCITTTNKADRKSVV